VENFLSKKRDFHCFSVADRVFAHKFSTLCPKANVENRFFRKNPLFRFFHFKEKLGQKDRFF